MNTPKNPLPSLPGRQAGTPYPLPSFIIGLDIGSSSIKGILWDSQTKRTVSKVQAPVETIRYEKNGCLFLEHDPEELFQSTLKLLQGLLNKKPRDQPVALGFASQRSSFLLVAKKTLKPVTPIISWQDIRGAGLLKELSRHANKIRQKTGLYCTPYYSLTKLLWLIRKDPKLQNRLASGEILFCFIPTYITLRLTQGKTFATDPTLAQRSLLLNLKSGIWDQELLESLGLSSACLPKIKNTADDYGSLSRQFFGEEIPIRSMIGDQQAALLACGLQSANQALINLGTGGFLLMPTGNRLPPVKGLLNTIVGQWDSVRKYALEGTVTSIGGTLEWLKHFGFLKDLDDLAIPENLDPSRLPLVLGSFGGLASPYWRSDFKVNLMNFDHTTTPNEFAMGFLLGLSHLFWEILSPLKNRGLCPKRLLASGGLSKNKPLLDILANYLDVTIQGVEDVDLTALGAVSAVIGKNFKGSLVYEKPILPNLQKQKNYKLLQKKYHKNLLALLKEKGKCP